MCVTKRVRLRDAESGRFIANAMMIEMDDKTYLTDLAFSRRDVINRLADLGHPFLLHAKKISDDPKSMVLGHWVSEMCGFWNKAIDLKLESTNKQVTIDLIKDYFLDGHAIEYNNRVQFVDAMVRFGCRRIYKNDLMKIVGDTILKGI